MTNYPMITPLSDLELDAVTGGNDTYNRTFNIRQNARGGDSLSSGGNGGAANATTGAATGGAGGASMSAAGGLGGMNSIMGPL